MHTFVLYIHFKPPTPVIPGLKRSPSPQRSIPACRLSCGTMETEALGRVTWGLPSVLAQMGVACLLCSERCCPWKATLNVQGRQRERGTVGSRGLRNTAAAAARFRVELLKSAGRWRQFAWLEGDLPLPGSLMLPPSAALQAMTCSDWVSLQRHEKVIF